MLLKQMQRKVANAFNKAPYFLIDNEDVQCEV